MPFHTHDAGREAVTTSKDNNKNPMGMLSDSVFAPWSLPFTITVQILSKYDFQVNAKKISTLHQKYSNRGKNPGNCSAA